LRTGTTTTRFISGPAHVDLYDSRQFSILAALELLQCELMWFYSRPSVLLTYYPFEASITCLLKCSPSRISHRLSQFFLAADRVRHRRGHRRIFSLSVYLAHNPRAETTNIRFISGPAHVDLYDSRRFSILAVLELLQCELILGHQSNLLSFWGEHYLPYLSAIHLAHHIIFSQLFLAADRVRHHQDHRWASSRYQSI
jgi:hypothetical protein